MTTDILGDFEDMIHFILMVNFVLSQLLGVLFYVNSCHFRESHFISDTHTYAKLHFFSWILSSRFLILTLLR